MSRILIIGLDYFGYTAEIVHAFERNGHNVRFYPIERAGFLAKTYRAVAGRSYRRRVDAYHRGIIEQNAGIDYDHVVFIQAHQFGIDTLDALKASQPRARFTLYNWDSIATHDYRGHARFFDRVWTFDPDDAVAHGFDYLPLFAVPAYFDARRHRTKDFDIYFVGALVTDERFFALRKFGRFCEAHGLRLKIHARCTPPVLFRFLRRGLFLQGMTLRSLSVAQIVDLVERSRATFDFANHRQSGYTMRFIENMAADCKIVTFNERVVREDFFSPDRFLVVERDDYAELLPFLATPIVPNDAVARYHIDAWAERLLASDE
jgi:hypothetical protein